MLLPATRGCRMTCFETRFALVSDGLNRKRDKVQGGRRTSAAAHIVLYFCLTSVDLSIFIDRSKAERSQLDGAKCWLILACT